MTPPPRYIVLTDLPISRKSVRGALKRLRDAAQLGAHPLAALDVVEARRAKSGYEANDLGRGLALRDLLHAAVETLKPQTGAIKPEEKRWRPYFIAQEAYVAGRSRLDLQAEMGIEPSTYSHEEAALMDRLASTLREWEMAARAAPEQPASPVAGPRTDWGEMRDVATFCGREEELARLTHWVLDERCRLVAVTGLGGAGKTALLEKLATGVAPHVEAVIWRSLLNAPALPDIVRDWIAFLTDEQPPAIPERVDQAIARLVDCLRARRCLLVLDNFEAIFQPNQLTGHYRPGYEAYGQLLAAIGERSHRSCLLLTSREKPQELARLAGAASPVRIFHLGGMAVSDAQALLHDRTIRGADKAWRALVRRCAGNPLALLLMADAIRDLFGGDIARFLHHGSAGLGDIGAVLDAQCERLTALERAVIEWLAIAREPVALETLRELMLHRAAAPELLPALHSLRRRLLVELRENGFTLQNMVMESVTDRLVRRCVHAILNGDLASLDSHALLRVQGKEYVRHSQERMIAQPLLDQLTQQLHSRQKVAHHLLALLPALRMGKDEYPGYAAGNLLNLLRCLAWPLDGVDCSGLTIREACLYDVTLQTASFRQTHFAGARFAQTFGAVSALAYSPTNAWIAIGAADGQVALWQPHEDALACVWQGHDSWILSASASVDGALLATASEDQTVRLWAVEGLARPPHCLHTLRGHTGRIRAVAFQPRTESTTGPPILASAGDDGAIILWDGAAGRPLQRLQSETGAIRSLAFLPGGDLLVSGGNDRLITLWDLRLGHPRSRWAGHAHDISKVICHPSGEMIASGGRDETVRIWQLPSGRCIKTLHAHAGPISTMTFSPDGRWLATASDDQTVNMWETGHYRCRWALPAHQSDRIRVLCFSPDSTTLVTGAEDQQIKLWDTASGRCLKVISGYMNWVQALAFHPDGERFASCGHDGVIRIWRATDGAAVTAWRGHPDRINSLTFDRQGLLLASAGNDCAIHLWDATALAEERVHSRRPLLALRGHQYRVRSIAFSPDGRLLASGSNDQTVRLWDVHNERCLRVLDGHDSDVLAVAFHPAGRYVASGSYDRSVRLWDTIGQEAPLVLRGHTDWVRALAFDAGGRLLASGGDDLAIRVWDPDSRRCVEMLCGHTRPIRGLLFTPDGKWLISAAEDQTIRVWMLPGGRCVKILHEPGGAVSALACSLRAPLLIHGRDDAQLGAWDLCTGEKIWRLRIPRPYEGMDITGASGLSRAQRAALFELGAMADAHVY